MRLTAIIPTLDEEHALPALLQALAGQVDEVVVADGGSRDRTVALARGGGHTVVEGARGRGAQLNAGARAATGEILWFLHADTAVPPGAGAALRRATAGWGCFRVRIDSRDPRLWWTGRVMSLRARVAGTATGDMGIWLRRELFLRLGGYDSSLRAFEDLELCDRARILEPPQVLGPSLLTSPRRWKTEGVNRTIARMLALRLGYRIGIDPHRLVRAYRSNPRET